MIFYMIFALCLIISHYIGGPLNYMFFHLNILLAAQSHYQQDIQSGRSLYETGMMAIQLQGGFNEGIMKYHPENKRCAKKTYLQTSQTKIKK